MPVLTLPDQTTITLDDEGHLGDVRLWSPAIAEQLAALDGIALDRWHLSVLDAVREFYARFEHAPNTRPLIKYLQQTVDPVLDSATLMRRFQTGRIARVIARYAGLPKPSNCL